jgi:eukaryotic-like serine/threonine-protein kinase
MRSNSFTEEADGRQWSFEPGALIVGDYRAWSCLGRGERCETWLAWSDRRFAPAVVKLLVPDDVGDPSSVKALAREARILARMSHPFLPRLYQDGTSRRMPFIALEYVEGPTLEHMVDAEGVFSPTDTATIGLQILMALFHLHQSGLAHLDVKPGNVMMRNRRIVLIDLGLVRPIGSPAPDGPAWGTDAFMAPEQAERAPASVAMDLYGVGATLAVLAGGRLPPPPGSPIDWRPRSGVGVRLVAAIEQFRSVDPEQRPQTVTDAMVLLRTIRPSLTPPWPVFADPGR